MKRLRPQKIVIQERNLRTILSYQVRYYENGKRVGKSFRTRSEAEAFASALESARSMPIDSKLNSIELLHAIEFGDMCKQLGVNICDAYEIAKNQILAFYSKDKGEPAMTLQKLIGQYMALKLRMNCRQATLDEYRVHFNRIERLVGKDTPITTIDSECIKKFLNACSTIPMKEHSLTRLNALFNYAVREGYLKESPSKNIHIEIPKKDHQPPTVFSIPEIKDILTKVLSYDVSTIAAYALLSFAGLRPEEICAKYNSKRTIQWEDIDFEKKEILLPGATSKIRCTRVLSNLPDNLWKFLELTPLKDRKGPVYKWSHSTYRRTYRSVVPKGKKDTFRHSFASYGYHYMPIHQLIEIMGHIRNYNEFCTHYKGVARPADAKAYFAITPESLKSE